MPTVLVVDDAAVDRKLVGGLLAKGTGLQVQFAASGEEALERLSAINPAVIVTDLVMPGMSGLELVARVVEQNAGIPVILMTGKGSEEIAVKALTAGAASYVPQGHFHRQLLTSVSAVLDTVDERTSNTHWTCCRKGGSFQLP